MKSASYPEVAETIERLRKAIHDYRGYKGPGLWTVRHIGDDAPFLSLEYTVSHNADERVISEILEASPHMPWNDFGGNAILKSANLEVYQEHYTNSIGDLEYIESAIIAVPVHKE